MVRIMSNTTPQKLETTYARRPLFALTTLGVFAALTVFLVIIDFVPEPPSSDHEAPAVVLVSSTTAATSTSHDVVTSTADDDSTSDEFVLDASAARVVEPMVGHYAVMPHTGSGSNTSPVRVRVPSIGVDTTVLTPASTEVDVLDRALLSGAVHYPGSGVAGENANMLIFGHSSYLPVVQNQAYRAFNELSTLQRGDRILVDTVTATYEYRVETVHLADADDAVIYFAASEPTLTLATCNTFGAKQERWVVTAVLK